MQFELYPSDLMKKIVSVNSEPLDDGIYTAVDIEKWDNFEIIVTSEQYEGQTINIRSKIYETDVQYQKRLKELRAKIAENIAFAKDILKRIGEI